MQTEGHRPQLTFGMSPRSGMSYHPKTLDRLRSGVRFFEGAVRREVLRKPRPSQLVGATLPGMVTDDGRPPADTMLAHPEGGPRRCPA